ncbi:MAG: bifunctional methylenetetrahydrofolate dehydrogenase/methenyltetrahydrofolate cyclohydrolase FolD [Chloroflexota bacterium]|nr:bifunctional methylenetetrahydrofolate dehydrogenase/methenyltetrahydrofolate cyclohydrolase FolD [Chloroflexota bacterium]MDE2941122.1 bifunctional methylenetetrahydrofolate dehydrogenase/methenyltetrahydrofolate cyclohydrolase FolD [Chloroflexota bacterium]MDE3267352.1 bifunctional methylenetetrahydrofolate dehydrogenase/methenyltetrahydrofolate cyclohydrolase FolD [Chloroflexota bacterium]
MTAVVIDGNAIAQEIRAEATQAAADLQARSGVAPGLAVVLVGDDPASAVYVRNKERACREAGIRAETLNLPGDTSQNEIIAAVRRLNDDPAVHGILVQLPLPSHVDERSVILSLDPDKDVDGLHPVNVGRLVQGEPLFVPCTPWGIQEMLVRSGHSPEGKHVVVCGRSDIVGKPVAMLLVQKQTGANATLTMCHTGTADLAAVTRTADILVVAIGRAEAVTADMVSEGAVVIDVGINRVDDATRQRGYRLVGDVDYRGVSEKAAAITPVPGGVGPMTVAMLLKNTLRAAERAIAGAGV